MATQDRVEQGQDVRYSFRVLRRSPGYALVVVAVLALGIAWRASRTDPIAALRHR